MWPISVYLTVVNKKLRSVTYLTSQVCAAQTGIPVPRQADEEVHCVGVGIFLCQKPFSFPLCSVWVSISILTQYYSLFLLLVTCERKANTKL